ncbi:hypothetical protein NEHOM01_2467, partial [Nematocida homosporus]|uniref:uncharacterized protein n=1 Tax=Nematocida homosporus TaxID=1912981 RepID=UPI00221EA6D2
KEGPEPHLIFPPGESYDILWLRLINDFSCQYAWLCHCLSIPKLSGIYGKVKLYLCDYNVHACESKDRKDLRQIIAKELIQNIAASAGLGGFTTQCKMSYSRIVCYKTKYCISEPTNSMAPIETLLFTLDWITHLAPLSPDNHMAITAVLDKVENAISQLEQDPARKLTYEAYIGHFSNVVDLIQNEINVILNLLASVHGFYRAVLRLPNTSPKITFQSSRILKKAWVQPDPTLSFDKNQCLTLHNIRCYKKTLPGWWICLGLYDSLTKPTGPAQANNTDLDVIAPKPNLI